MTLSTENQQKLDKALAKANLRPTKQREHLFEVLLNKRDHPTAEEVYARAKPGMPSISMATVYNCLEVFVQVGIVRQVNLERGPSRYCPNLAHHAHFHCSKSGKVYDIDFPEGIHETLKSILPEGFNADSCELSFIGEAHENQI